MIKCKELVSLVNKQSRWACRRRETVKFHSIYELPILTSTCVYLTKASQHVTLLSFQRHWLQITCHLPMRRVRVMRRSHPASLLNVGGSTQILARAWNIARQGTFSTHLQVAIGLLQSRKTFNEKRSHKRWTFLPFRSRQADLLP
jgi:hypothetical protein